MRVLATRVLGARTAWRSLKWNCAQHLTCSKKSDPHQIKSPGDFIGTCTNLKPGYKNRDEVDGLANLIKQLIGLPHPQHEFSVLPPSLLRRLSTATATATDGGGARATPGPESTCTTHWSRDFYSKRSRWPELKAAGRRNHICQARSAANLNRDS